MLKMSSLLIFFFSSLWLQAVELKIGVSQTNTGRVLKSDIANILKCTSESKNHVFQFQDLPNLRGLKYVEDQVIDAFYPVHVNQNNINHSLLPIYIDEILLVSKNPIDITSPLKIGAIRGDHDNIFDERENFNLDYVVSNSDSLVKGLENNRTKNILIYRSQIPAGLDLSLYFIHTVVFQDVGIQFNYEFIKKLKKSKDDLQKKFISCILNYDFKLSNIRKRAIHMSIAPDIENIQKSIKFTKVTIKDMRGKDALWEKGDHNLFKSVLSNSLSENLETMTRKYPYINEVFIFNHQGALLASQKLTSDYDQSDEEKFAIVRDYKDFTIRNISNIYFDESSNSFQVGIYIRVNDSKGEFIGGIYLGADINKLITFYKLN